MDVYVRSSIEVVDELVDMGVLEKVVAGKEIHYPVVKPEVLASAMKECRSRAVRASDSW